MNSAESIKSLTDGRKALVSPWTVVAEPYSDGAQAIITTPTNGIAKYLLRNSRLTGVDFLPLDRDSMDFDWGIVLLRGGLGISTERKHNRFVIFGDQRPAGPNAPLEVKDRITIDRARYGGLTAHFSLAPDGHLIALTDSSRFLAIDLTKRVVVASYTLPTTSGYSVHNSFPIDKQGRIYLAGQNEIMAIDWTGSSFSNVWTARYDMRGPGCKAPPEKPSRRREAIAVARGKLCTGSGTTPTLIGNQSTGLVVIVDGHAPKNNLVGFWRDAPPRNWRGLNDPSDPTRKLSRQLAGIIALPHSTPVGKGFSAENSPAALGNAIIVAQWAGFRPRRRPARGVQRVDWDPQSRRFVIAWTNAQTHFNGVPTIACHHVDGCHVYGMGRYKRRYLYRSLDFETGRVSGESDLGTDASVLDQGNNHAVASDGSVIYSGRSKMLRVR